VKPFTVLSVIINKQLKKKIMKLFINKENGKNTLVIANSKKEAREICSTSRRDYQAMNFAILDNNPNINDFHDGYGDSDFHVATALPRNEVDFVQKYGVSNLPK
jgi:hypothetical protein